MKPINANCWSVSESVSPFVHPSQSRFIEADPKDDQPKKYRTKMNDGTNALQGLINFNNSVIFGPIFICSCCHRKLFENGVTKITADFKEDVEKQEPDL